MFRALAIRSDEGLTLKMSAFTFFASSTQLINLNFYFKVNTAEKISDSFASLDKLRKCLAKNVFYDMAELVRTEK